MSLTNILLIIVTFGIFWIGCVLSVLGYVILEILRPIALLNEDLEADGFLSGLRTSSKPPEFRPVDRYGAWGRWVQESQGTDSAGRDETPGSDSRLADACKYPASSVPVEPQGTTTSETVG